MADDDVIVAVEPDLFEGKDAGAGDAVTKVAPEKKATTEKAPSQELVDQFKAEAARERERREAAERQAATARQTSEKLGRDVVAAREEVADRELDSINTGIAAAQTEAEAASGEYTAAFDAGDATKMAAAQRKMARAEAKAVRLDEAKADLEARKAARPETRTEQRPDQTRQAPADPVDAYIQGRTEPTANWLRSHREWISDPRKNAKLTAAHFDAVGNDLAPDTPEYFEHVETFIGLRQAEGDGKTEVKPNGAGKARRTPPAAPGQHSGGGTNGGGTEVRLSANESRAATDGTHVWGKHDLAAGRIKDANLVGSPIGNQEMARRKLAMQQQGLYDRTYLEQ